MNKGVSTPTQAVVTQSDPCDPAALDHTGGIDLPDWLDYGFTETDAHDWHLFFDDPGPARHFYPHLDAEVAFAWSQVSALRHIPTIETLIAAGWTPSDTEWVAAGVERVHDTCWMWLDYDEATDEADPNSTETALVRLAATGTTPEALRRALNCGLRVEEIEDLHATGAWDGDALAVLTGLRS